MDAKVETGEVAATLYRTGPGSIAVTVPLRWARARGLKPGDRVTLRLGRNLLLVPANPGKGPGEAGDPPRNPETARVSSGVSPRERNGAFPALVGGDPRP